MVLLIVSTIFIVGILAAYCDCNYDWRGLLAASECYISKARHKGYKCRCWYKGSLACGTVTMQCLNKFVTNAKPCNKELNEGECDGCKDRMCCSEDWESFKKGKYLPFPNTKVIEICNFYTTEQLPLSKCEL